MRYLLSFLSMLLLAANLSAQPLCEINDLTATVGVTNPLTCQYFVTITFVSTGTTNQFIVQGNGNNYGTFTYNQVPVILGPFTAGATASTREFVIKDAVLADCEAAVQVEIPGCSLPQACDIYEAKATPGDCLPGGSAYKLTVDFEVTEPGAQTFDLYNDNGNLIGNYPLSQLPLTINYAAGTSPVQHLKICLHENPNCCETVEFIQPICPCTLQDLVVETGNCNADSTYHLFLNFPVPITAVGDSFAVYANGEFFKNYALTQLPLQIPNFPWNGGAFDEIRVCISGTSIASCCGELEFHVPTCFPYEPCELSQLKLKVGECHPDSTFTVTLDFQVATPAQVDSFDLWANAQYLGKFGINQLPLTIPNFDWNGNIFSTIRVCTGSAPGCCREKQFLNPACLPFGPCDVTNIFTQVGACTSTGAYNLTVNFQATNPGNGNFTLTANGQLFGTFPLTSLPLLLPNFPASGNANDVIQICIIDLAGAIPCCESKEFAAPVCNLNCEILELEVTTGDCTGDSSYVVHINFVATHAPSNYFKVFANGVLFGAYTLNQLPLTIQNFPWNGGNNDVIKVCLVQLNGELDCCKTIEFAVPGCLQTACDIHELEVSTGDCTGDSTYVLHVNFQVTGTTSNTFVLYANGQAFGTYNLNQLPLTIENFPWNGGNNDFIKVCMVTDNGVLTCCKVIEFAVPPCLQQQGDCHITDLVVDPGVCNPAGGYSLLVNFQVQNPGNALFNVYANGQLLGTFPLGSLPLLIPNFPASGNAVDHIKICINDQPNCCVEQEFQALPCAVNCDIHDLTVQTGTCEGDSAYHVTVNFIPVGTTATTFQLYANGQLFGTYNVSQLPLTIPNFPWNGGNNDVLKVCMVTNTINNCCETKEFPVPACLLGGNCEVFNVVVTPGDCHPPNNVYSLVVNFQVQNPGNTQFEVWAGNGQYLGIFPLSALPLTITNFPWGGGAIDNIKICINDHPNCCRTVEFPAPTCFGNNCEINDLAVQTGDCQGDSSYQVYVNFVAVNPPVATFSVFANGQFYGSFGLNQLPLMIPNFPWNGGNNDVIKICFGTAGALNCCETLEFAVPNCLLQPCQIYDLQAVHTPCLCGQFFAVLTFEHTNGSAGGFDVVGNGTNYGTFPYNTPQPIILGPFAGDNTTMYEFGVRDHQHNDCQDDVLLGKVDCPTLATNSPLNGATLLLAPNPTNDYLNATALLPGGARLGQTDVDVYHADGRLMLSQVVGDGSSFQLNVSVLPAGVYRLALRSELGSLQGTFTKL